MRDVALTIYSSDKQSDRYIVRFTSDNIAELDGMYKHQDGHYVGPVSFVEVTAIIDADDLCEQTGISHVTLASPSPLASGAQAFYLRVHCSDRSKSFRNSNPAASAAVEKLTALVAKQTWRRTGASQIDERILLGQ